MAEEGLKIKIGADVVEVVQSLNQLQTEFNDLNKQIKNAVPGSTQFNELSRQLAFTEAKIKGVNAAAGQAGTGLKNNLVTGSNQASAALTNFGRVASDAPFGLIGIANNIDPLVQSFVLLRKETGSGKAALAALTASLTGGGGLVLAVSLVTSALQFASLGLSRWGQNTEEANEATKKAKEELDKYTEAQKNSVRNTTLQKLEIEGLVATAKNLNLSENDRITAINKLNEIIPDNIGYINQQNIATQEGSTILKEYIKAIEAKATAELFANKIAENNAKLFENRNKILAESEDVTKKIEEAKRKIAVEDNGSLRRGKELGAIEININAQQERLLRLQKEARDIASDIFEENEKLRDEYLKIIDTVNTLNTENKSNLNNTENSIDDINDLLKQYSEQLKGINWDEQNRQIDGTKLRLELAGETLKTLYLKGVQETSDAWKAVKADFDNFQREYDKFLRDQRLKQINEDIKNYANNIGSYSENVLAKSQTNTIKALQAAGKAFILNSKAQEKYLNELNKKNLELANTITGYLSPALEGVFESLVKGEDPFEALKNSVQQLIIQLGKAVIQSLILKAVTSAIGGPVTGSASGLGLNFIRGDQLRSFTFGR